MNNPKPQPTAERIDNLSLEQALRDFEAANARVLDLTQRLLTSERQRQEFADQLERFRLFGETTVSMLGRLGLTAGETANKVLKKVYRKLKP
jgi:hypothetical protein